MSSRGAASGSTNSERGKTLKKTASQSHGFQVQTDTLISCYCHSICGGNETTYRLLPYDGLEAVKGPTVKRLINTLDLQPHLEKMHQMSECVHNINVSSVFHERKLCPPWPCQKGDLLRLQQHLWVKEREEKNTCDLDVCVICDMLPIHFTLTSV